MQSLAQTHIRTNTYVVEFVVALAYLLLRLLPDNDMNQTVQQIGIIANIWLAAALLRFVRKYLVYFFRSFSIELWGFF